MEIGTQELRLDADRVVKHFGKDLLVEAFKHQQLARIGVESGFQVPELLTLDEQASTLTYRFIDGLTSCRYHYLQYVLVRNDSARDAWHESLFVQIGRTLAVIHRGLDVESRTQWQAPPVFEQVVKAFTGGETHELLSTTPHALLHGDFGFSNVCTLGKNSQRLHIIDPSPNFYSSFSCSEYASIYLDIGKFSLCLRGLIPLASYLKAHRSRAARMRELFLQGYTMESGVEVQEETLSVVERALLTCKIRHEMRTSLARTAAGITLFGLRDGRVIGKIANAK